MTNTIGVRKTRTWLWMPVVLAAGVLAAGCNSGSGGGDDGNDAGSTGTASFAVTDAPADKVTEVWVTFDRIDVKPKSGPRETIELEEAVTVDLLTLQGENAAPLIEDVELPAGEYNYIRLFVQSGWPHSKVLHEGGGEMGLYIPGNQPPSQNPNPRFLQLSSPFVIPADGHADFVIDVELRKALVDRGDFYMLRPSLRLVDNSEVGSIFGTVDDPLILDEACTSDPNTGAGNAVYVYQGFEAVPGDVYVDEDGQEQERTDGAEHPVTVANVKQKEDSMTFAYTVGFLPAGEYTIAFTCQAADDDPEAQDGILFPQQHDVVVMAGERTEQNFAD